MRRLAEGAYGAVFLARDLKLERQVAVKLLFGDAMRDRATVERFTAEARVTAQIAHPNVVRVIDHGADAGVPWIAYELVEGGSLRELLEARGGALPLVTALDAAAQTAEGLAAAHWVGAVHRDVKPENVLVAGPHLYKLVDFGIAKWTAGVVRTRSGVLLGTPAYIAPELIQGGDVTPAADVYGLGVMLFELLTGTRPFHDDNVAALLALHVKAAPPRVRERRPDLPEALDRIVAHALAKRPQDRCSARELAARLEELLVATPSPAEAPSTVATRRVVAPKSAAVAVPRRGVGATIALVAVLVAAALVVRYVQSDRPVEPDPPGWRTPAAAATPVAGASPSASPATPVESWERFDDRVSSIWKQGKFLADEPFAGQTRSIGNLAEVEPPLVMALRELTRALRDALQPRLPGTWWMDAVPHCWLLTDLLGKASHAQLGGPIGRELTALGACLDGLLAEQTDHETRAAALAMRATVAALQQDTGSLEVNRHLEEAATELDRAGPAYGVPQRLALQVEIDLRAARTRPLDSALGDRRGVVRGLRHAPDLVLAAQVPEERGLCIAPMVRMVDFATEQVDHAEEPRQRMVVRVVQALLPIIAREALSAPTSTQLTESLERLGRWAATEPWQGAREDVAAARGSAEQARAARGAVLRPVAGLAPDGVDLSGMLQFRRAKDGGQMVLVPGGNMVLGAPEGPRRVWVSGFLIDRHAVTVASYRAFCQATRAAVPDVLGEPRFGAPTQPVVGVSFDDAKAYAAWCDAGLPTAAEWERAARGGLTSMTYPWGNDDPATRACFGRDAGSGGPAPVGSYAPNAFGLFDMTGNVWQWCDDWLGDVRGDVDPRGPDDGRFRVTRGGSWGSGPPAIALVQGVEPGQHRYDTGFRLARPIR